MIKKFFILFFFCLSVTYSQSPEKFTYQSIIKNSSGYLLKNQDVGLRISVLLNSSNGIAVYSEEHTIESNNNGLVTLIIGDGFSSDVFSDIDWGGGEYYLKVEVDPEGGVNYVMNQTSQLLSVPYALYAGNSGSNLNLLGKDYIILNSQTLTINNIDLTDDVDGVLPIDNGGTGVTSAPMVQLIDTHFGVEQAYITTVHSYTKDQSLHDSPHKDLRRARAGALSIIPTTTGAAKALTKIFPHLEIGGCGIRVPVPNGSLTDMTFIVKKNCTIHEVNKVFLDASLKSHKNYVAYTEAPIVSVDVLGNKASCLFDSQLTSVLGKMVKVVAWYDNEMGYANRLADLIIRLNK